MDLVLDPALLRRLYPCISENVVAGLHARRAGWLDAQGFGQYLLAQARRLGARLVRAAVTGLEIEQGRLQAVRLSDGSRLPAAIFVNAAGPFFRRTGELAGLNLPVHTELHLKVAFRDSLGAIDRHAPLLIWKDPQRLPWSDEERTLWAEDPATRWLLEEFPSGAHTRPEGGAGRPTGWRGRRPPHPRSGPRRRHVQPTGPRAPVPPSDARGSRPRSLHRQW